MTAVEWLVEQMKLDELFNADYFIEQAKAMEKEQMRNASCPYIGGWEEDEFEQWYNTTFKSE